MATSGNQMLNPAKDLSLTRWFMAQVFHLLASYMGS